VDIMIDVRVSFIIDIFPVSRGFFI